MKVALAVYLAVLHLVIGAAVARHFLPHSDQAIEAARLAHLHRENTVPDGAVLFLGDSITQRLAVAAVAPKAVNYGIGHQRSDQLIESMDIYKSMERAQQVVITIGTNDIAQGREENIEQRYHTILGKVPAGVPVVLSSPPPMEHFDVASVAEAARQACASDQRCLFLDTFSLLSERGRPQAGVLLPDGAHLSPAGYRRWVKLLQEALSRNHAIP